MALKVTKTESTPWALFVGDSLKVGVSHELRIDGDATWVSYSITTSVSDGETAEDAHERVVSILMAKVADTVHRTVENIRKMSD